jgi:hypothetical protein
MLAQRDQPQHPYIPETRPRYLQPHRQAAHRNCRDRDRGHAAGIGAATPAAMPRALANPSSGRS